MSRALNIAKIRAAKAAYIHEAESQYIEQDGQCPHYWGHFDNASFAVGIFVGLFLGFVIASIRFWH